MNERQATRRSRKYLEFIRTLPCAVTGRTDNIHAHHIRLGANAGLGLKPSDYRAVPLCPEAHHELHAKGEASFWDKYGHNHELLIAKCMFLYAFQNRMNLSVVNHSIEAVIHAVLNDFKDEAEPE